MTVFVDDAMIEWKGRRWCHLTADSADELHEFAKALGLQRSWFQERDQWWLCHYDVTDIKREQAIRMGAVAETSREAVARGLRQLGVSHHSVHLERNRR